MPPRRPSQDELNAESGAAARIAGKQTEKQPCKKPYQKPILTRYGRERDLSTAGPCIVRDPSPGTNSGHDPQRRTSPVEIRATLELPRLEGDRRAEGTAMNSLRVLVVDDDRLLQQILRDDLEANGFQVATAADGSEAFCAIPEFNPDVVVIDVMRPAENGDRFCRAIKELGSHGIDAGPKIIFLTSRRLDDDDVRKEVLLGFSQADAMLSKPCDPAHLRETIARLLAT